VRSDLLERGRRYAGWKADGELHPEAVEPAVASTALAVAVQEGEPDFFDALLERLTLTKDAAVRRQIQGALGRATDPVLAARVRELLLDPRLQGYDILEVLGAHMAERDNRPAAWDWMKQHVGALLGRLPLLYARYLAMAVGRFLCTAEAASELERVLAPHLDKVPGGRQELQVELEQIRCRTALVEAQKESACAYFESRKVKSEK
jgi:hypothetical protein